ncbi:unnamed protein product [Ceutorhynchus assimilis]|uniref:ATP-dependent DNA helicase n=1 Tax=Ceutorhynchus assimilis TaxID=467358 RepID=A0A9N9ME96_9CUCU|nr:unnamed protein product [Ceutorhynchus assimilis]
MWQANIDMQPCGSNESIAYYIAKYLSKCEPTDLDSGIVQAIQQIRREQCDVSRKLFKICMRIMKERQVSACECVYRLCHLPLRDSSRKTVFVNTRKPQQRYKVLKFNEQGQAVGYCANIFERYEKRPREHPDYDFNNMSLLEFAMLFEPYYKKTIENDDVNIDQDAYEVEQPKRKCLITLTDNTKVIKRATLLHLLMQYIPYRDEEELLRGFGTARDAFLTSEDRLKEISAYMELYRRRDKQLEDAFNQVHAFQILEEVQPLQPDNEEEIVEQVDVMNENDFQTAKQAMNAGQKEIYFMVTKSIQDQMNGKDERLRFFFTGGAGVGKTFLLNLLRNQINRCYAKVAVKVAALTGVAARLINGSTLHSTLRLPVQKDGRITNMPLLTGNYLRVMRQQWKDTEFFIIDEISMFSYQMLTMIDSRLRQLKNRENEFFGGINVLLFGDLLQLPPIKTSGTPVYKQPEHMHPATNLWRLFTLCELTENMRQQGDNSFIDILNALRVGELKAEHLSKLLEKVLVQPSGEFSIDDIISIDVNKTGGLPKELQIFVGAKIMLRSNIDITKGLVNGAIGFVTEIIWPHFRRTQIYETDIPSVRVDFGKDGIQVIQPKTIQFPAKFSYGTAERRMLPLIFSWATTVHKMQGSTVENAVIYLGPKLFEEGQTCVALSRVKSLNGLRIEELDCAKLTGKNHVTMRHY